MASLSMICSGVSTHRYATFMSRYDAVTTSSAPRMIRGRSSTGRLTRTHTQTNTASRMHACMYVCMACVASLPQLFQQEVGVCEPVEAPKTGDERRAEPARSNGMPEGVRRGQVVLRHPAVLRARTGEQQREHKHRHHQPHLRVG